MTDGWRAAARRFDRERPRRTRAAVAGALALACATALGASLAPARAGAEPSAPPTAPARVDAPSAKASAAPRDVEALLAALRGMPGFYARFEEEKQIALLAAPLTSAGELHFAPPRTLLRRTTAPSPSDLLIDGDRVVVREPARHTEIDLAAQPAIRPLVESLLWVLAGDRRAIEQAYHADYALDAEHDRWTLRLTPRTAPLDQLVEAIVVAGESRRPERFTVVETSGDRTETRLFDVDPERRWSAAERNALFAIRAE